MDVGLELVHVPALFHRQRALGDDGAAVVLVVGKVDGHARHLDAVVKGVLDGVRALEAGQQRRVDVDHAVGEGRKQRLVNHAHVAGHDDVLTAMGLELGGNDLVGGNGVRVNLLAERQRLDAGRLGALEAIGARARAHHQANARVQAAIGNAVNERLQVGAASADEDADGQGLRLGCGGLLGLLVILDQAADAALAAPVAHR